MNEPLNIAAIIFFILCIIFLVLFVGSLKKKKYFGAARDFVFAFLMLTLSLLFGVISFSIQGYNALTKEELAATVEVQPVTRQSFSVKIIFPDGDTREYDLEGEEFYIDAHILKWKSVANLFGLHTFYELDRVSGRYTDIEDETNKKRTVYSLAKEKVINIFKLRLDYPFLSFLVDAQYGSATFINVNEHKKLNVFVSTTGLLIRDAEE